MIVEEEDKLAERRELVCEGLRELREATLEAAAAIEERRELLAERRRVPAQGADEIREHDEGVFVAALQRQPRRPPARRPKQVGVLGEHGRLAIAGGRVHERQPVTASALEPVEQPLPSKEWERQ
jgi:hypothetical protein